MKQQDWTEELRRHLADYEEPVPDGLWDDIEECIQQRPRAVLLRRWAAVVAACGLLLFGTWQLLHTTHSVTPELPTLAKTGGPETIVISPPAPDPTGEVYDVPDHPQPSKHDSQPTESNQQEEAMPVLRQQEPSTSVQHQQDGTPPVQDQQNEDTPVRRQQEPSTPVRRQQSGHHRFSLQMHAANLMADNGISRTDPMLMSDACMGPLSSALARNTPVYLTGHDEKTEHHMPFTVGLSVRMSISDRLWMSSGINYTRTTSVFSRQLGPAMQTTHQKLHYLGVPVAAGYTFWQPPRLTAYVSAGAEAQYNVKTEVSEGHLDRDRLQFSLLASAGAEYNLLPHISIFMQPGLRYYPDNGSHLQNIFKERPMQFDLQLGIRLSLKP